MPTNDDIEKCLTSLGVEKRQIIPTNITQNALRPAELNQFRNEINIFPLDWFDSDDGDSEFFAGCREGSFVVSMEMTQFLTMHLPPTSSFYCAAISCPGTINLRSCLPKGLAFLPASSLRSPELNADDFDWREVTVEKHNETANKWRIKELKSAAVYEVPRIYLMFLVEDPFMFAQRIHRAIQLRCECENRLKFDAVVDGIILSEIPKPPQRCRDTVRKLLRYPNNGWMEIFESEHTTLYQKTLAALDLIKFLQEDPHSFPSIQLPTMERGRKLKSLSMENRRGGVDRETFKQSQRDFQRMWLYCCPEAIKIMEFINNECDDVSRMSLFQLQTDACSLMGFVDANRAKHSTISNFLEHTWIEDVVAVEVGRRLASIGKGWFDPLVKDWRIYQMSKLHRLIELMKQRMEIAVGHMLRSSLRAFVNHLCQPCESMLNDVTVNFVWGNDDLVTSRFPCTQPVFELELCFVDGEPAYTTNLDDFEVEIIQMFKSRLLTTHEIPQIDPYLVTQLKFDKALRLPSIGFLDVEFQHQIHCLQRCYRKCLVLLRGYAREYRKFSEFMNLSIPDYVRSVRENIRTAKEMKEEISIQQKSIDEIGLTVPSTIVIGPFQINVSSVKEDLIVKRSDLYEALLLMFADVLREKLQAIDSEYKQIFGRLSQKRETVEELVEVQQWMPEISREMKLIGKKLEQLTAEFEVLDSFKVALSDETFGLKISSKLMSKEILRKIEERQLQHQFEFEQFRKLQLTHEVQFLEQIEALAESVETSSTHHGQSQRKSTSCGALSMK